MRGRFFNRSPQFLGVHRANVFLPRAQHFTQAGVLRAVSVKVGAQGNNDDRRAIAAASILAKVARDACMSALDADYPGYGLARHKGYPTPEHKSALLRLGPTPLHRRSFAPVMEALQETL